MATPQPLGVFIIYAREDEPYRHDLVRHLHPLKREGKVWIWTDRELIAGDVWEPIIKEKLRSADIILLLISVDYFSSDYIHEVEIKEAFARHESGDARIIPIIVRPCVWKSDKILGNIQALPTGSIAVSAWPNYETAWVNVVEEIGRIIEQSEIQKANKERVRHEQTERERLALLEAKRKEREALARKKHEKLNKIERERIATEQEELRKQDWTNLLEYPTTRAYQNYLKAYPDHPSLKEVGDYPALLIIHKVTELQTNLNNKKDWYDTACGIVVFGFIMFLISIGEENEPKKEGLMGNIESIAMLALFVLFLYSIRSVIEFFGVLRQIRLAKSGYKRRFGSELQ